MNIERIQVEEGFLDGLDIILVPGLNVIIGARGTGKTSLIELIRFCLDVKATAAETRKRSREHALSVLGSGQVTITISNGPHKITVSRTAADATPRASASFITPIIFSQTEIESIGLQPAGRLQLLDSFNTERRLSEAGEDDAISTVRSFTAEAQALRSELDAFNRQVAELTAIDQQLLDLVPEEQLLAGASVDARGKTVRLNALSEVIASTSVAATSIDRFRQAVLRWHSSIANVSNAAPTMETWPTGAGQDVLSAPREQILRAKHHLVAALNELTSASSTTTQLTESLGAQKNNVEEQARQLRREIDTLQAGAGAVARRGQVLRERKAQLESLRVVANQRSLELDNLLNRRGKALDQLDTIREERFKRRARTAAVLNAALGPRIRLVVSRSGQFEAFSSAIADVLKGSGMRYGDLAPTLAEHISPRELLEAADTNDFELIADAAQISKDRSARVLAQIKDADLGRLATVPVEDAVSFQLLDGPDYKDISALSTGQRCSVVLPLVLRHTERLLIVDQPEDHIDNAFIVDTLIRSVLARDMDGQIIFSTHNANIPVLGNANRVVQLGSDGRRGFALEVAPLDEPNVVSAISRVMEGGAEAFERRASFYGQHGVH